MAGNTNRFLRRTPPPITPTESIAIRPASHTPNSSISGGPESGNAPVQFGTAVNRKPATAAAANPKIISCACQANGELPNIAQGGPCKEIHATQMLMVMTAKTPAPRKNGRKP